MEKSCRKYAPKASPRPVETNSEKFLYWTPGGSQKGPIKWGLSVRPSVYVGIFFEFYH